jgi:hypothetical protein
MALPDKATFATLGGEISDYSAVEDPTTDLAGTFSSETRADVAAMTRMIPRAFVSFTTTGASCTVVDHDAVWGSDLSVKPVVTIDPVYGATYVITWPTTVTDARGVQRALNLRRALGNVEAGGWTTATYRRSANVIAVTTGSTVDSSLSAPPDSITPITVWVW